MRKLYVFLLPFLLPLVVAAQGSITLGDLSSGTSTGTGGTAPAGGVSEYVQVSVGSHNTTSNDSLSAAGLVSSLTIGAVPGRYLVRVNGTYSFESNNTGYQGYLYQDAGGGFKIAYPHSINIQPEDDGGLGGGALVRHQYPLYLELITTLTSATLFEYRHATNTPGSEASVAGVTMVAYKLSD